MRTVAVGGAIIRSESGQQNKYHLKMKNKWARGERPMPTPKPKRQSASQDIWLGCREDLPASQNGTSSVLLQYLKIYI